MTEQAEAAARPPIIQYWHSADVPAEVGRLVDTFRERNPSFRHLLFDRAAAEGLIEQHFGAREVAAFRACAIPAMQADYLRYCAALALGGIYADVDLRCLRSLQALVDSVGEVLLFRRPRRHLVNGFFLSRRPGHPLLELALALATANIERRAQGSVWRVTGPWVFTELHIHSQRGEGVEALGELGGHDRLALAFERVRMAEFREASRWVSGPDRELVYKRGEAHWVNSYHQGAPLYR